MKPEQASQPGEVSLQFSLLGYRIASAHLLPSTLTGRRAAVPPTIQFGGERPLIHNKSQKTLEIFLNSSSLRLQGKQRSWVFGKPDGLDVFRTWSSRFGEL